MENEKINKIGTKKMEIFLEKNKEFWILKMRGKENRKVKGKITRKIA
jgi:hypothetical protein